MFFLREMIIECIFVGKLKRNLKMCKSVLNVIKETIKEQMKSDYCKAGDILHEFEDSGKVCFEAWG